MVTHRPVASGRSPSQGAFALSAPETGKAANVPGLLKVGATPNIDRRTGNRLKRGQLPVDGKIDLHGLTLEQAHAGLSAFIKDAYSGHARCVIVVTGKGRAGAGIGKIRAELPHWLNQPALRTMVLAVTEAHVHDGGTGAFYVLLKRARLGSTG